MRVLALAVAIALAATACGGGNGDEAAPTSTAVAATGTTAVQASNDEGESSPEIPPPGVEAFQPEELEGLLITLSELPTGWTHATNDEPDDDDSDIFQQCGLDEPDFERVGEAEAEFEDAETTFLGQHVMATVQAQSIARKRRACTPPARHSWPSEEP